MYFRVEIQTRYLSYTIMGPVRIMLTTFSVELCEVVGNYFRSTRSSMFLLAFKLISVPSGVP